MSLPRSDLIELCRHLRQEKLYVQHEKGQLVDLNRKVKLATENLAHMAWVAREQRENLHALIFSSRGLDASPAVCCQKATLLEQTRFEESYKLFGHQEILYSEFLRNLRQNGKLLASCLAVADKEGLKGVFEVISTIFSGLYGCCLMPEDEKLVLHMLHILMKLQLTTANNPRKLLRQGTCAFSRMYKIFTEDLFTAKLFLTSALYEPILSLLTEDEIFLDIDPAKMIIRFSPQEKLKKFGKEDSLEFKEKLKIHREFIVSKLETITNRFINGIKSNMHCFPPSLARLLRTMYSLLMASGRSEPKEVNAVCVDIIFDLFICPAMVDPNPVGIIDTPISYIARSNLMQVAQILQVLALWKWEDIDPKLMDLYSRFDKEVMSSILENMLKAGEMSNDQEDDDWNLSNVNQDQDSNLLTRTAVLMTRSQLEGLISLLRSVSETGSELIEQNELTNLLSPLPESIQGSSQPLIKASSPLKSDDSSNDSTNRSKKHVLVNKLSNVTNKHRKMESDDSSSFEDIGLTSRELEIVLVIPISENSGTEMPGLLTEEHVLTRYRQTSRVVRMNLANLPGDSGTVGASGSEENSSFLSGAAGEKRTRFSLSHDEGSIGNASDNLEVISEAASNHSVDSSLEDEGDHAEDPIVDNLSDMVSANVSGRGTPNVSGRDTPSSQVTEGEELAGRAADDEAANEAAVDGNHQEPQPLEENNRQNAAPPIGVSGGRKSGEPDLEEKFGRFEIKPPNRPPQSTVSGFSSEHGDETVSMVSDTWSTDVLASDTETLGENDNRSAVLEELVRNNSGEMSRNRVLDELVVPQTPGGSSSLASASAANLLDIAETASEAWSMDVLASDSESLRLGELDYEDSASVARSDDTRFTDDTTRSDPDPGLDVSTSSVTSGPGSIKGRRDVDVTLLKRGACGHGGDMNGQFRPSRAAAVEQWARQSGGNNGILPRRGSDSSGIGMLEQSMMKQAGNKKPPSMVENSILKKATLIPGSGSTTASKILQATPSNGTVINSNSNSVDDTPSENVPKLNANLSFASIGSSEGSAAELSAQENQSKTGKVKPLNLTNSKQEQVAEFKPNHINNPPQNLMDTDNPVIIPTTSSNETRSAPNSASGAIPKSISFDKTVFESSSFDSGDQPSKHGGKSRDRNSFFKNFKLPKIGKQSARAGGSINPASSGARTSEFIRSSERLIGDDTFNIPEDDEPNLQLRRAASDETSDDILAKYRKKSSDNDNIIVCEMTSAVADEIDERLLIDPNNIESSYAFQDAKRKLRLMLSGADPNILFSFPRNILDSKDGKQENDILWFLRVLLAEAHNLQDSNMVAQLHETSRCVSRFNADGCKKLIRSLKDDYKKRSPYLSYLVRCRQGLLTTLAKQRRLLARTEVDQKVCSQYLVSVCMRMFLEQRERQLQQFVLQFKDIGVPDERVTLMEQFLTSLWKQLEEEPTWALVASEEQMNLARLTIERSVVSHIYMYAMFPNGEADFSRDLVLSQHITKLSSNLAPGHRDLRIPRQYHYEAPWPSAQAEIHRLAAYKTAQDKVKCVVRCSQTIMNLLSLSSSKSVPAADDFVPVLVFVMIKANPPSLLSTVQYVDNFFANRLSGESQYWWMQFSAAIEFIKTMDYQE